MRRLRKIRWTGRDESREVKGEKGKGSNRIEIT
jgi:hypothetical protein